MANPTVSNPAIPADSLFLVTGVNGLVASHAADQLLAAGYRVRGTVRSANKNEWMVSLFKEKYGAGRFELEETPDVYLPGVWDPLVKGVAGIAHVLGATDKGSQHIDQAVEDELPLHLALLEAANKEPTVKSFVYTSSVWAVFSPDASKERTLTEGTWNEAAVTLARSDVPAQEKGLAPYMALKTLIEQKIWAWVKQKSLPFTFNTVLLSTVIGKTLQPRELGMPSTAGFVKAAYDGSNMDTLKMMPPQWCVDTGDVGMVYVGALTTGGVDGRRLFVFGARYSWPKVIEILGQTFPEKTLPVLPDGGWDQTTVPNELAGELLRSVKGAGWETLEESVKAGAACF